jgi:hypothetical protein
MCEVARMLVDGVGLPQSVQGLLAHLMARWDGNGPLGGAKGEQIPLPMRIVHVAVEAAFQRLLGTRRTSYASSANTRAGWILTWPPASTMVLRRSSG